MDAIQTFTKEVAAIDTAVKEANNPLDVINTLDHRHKIWIDYNALNGLVFDNDAVEMNSEGQPIGAPLKKMTVETLAHKLGVTRQTLNNWRNSIPNLWGEVNRRRIEMSGQQRLARVHETWYLKAVKGDFQHLQLWLANFDPNFRMPSQKVEVEAGNSWAALLSGTRKADAIEGEVTNGA